MSIKDLPHFPTVFQLLESSHIKNLKIFPRILEEVKVRNSSVSVEVNDMKIMILCEHCKQQLTRVEK